MRVMYVRLTNNSVKIQQGKMVKKCYVQLKTWPLKKGERENYLQLLYTKTRKERIYVKTCYNKDHIHSLTEDRMKVVIYEEKKKERPPLLFPEKKKKKT